MNDFLEMIPAKQPSSVAELGDIVRRAAADGQAIYPCGGRTMLDLGLSPTKPGVAVDIRKLDQVIDYPARDMTITVQAGITIAKLQETLRAEKQRLPIDVPFPDRATLGGAAACNASGPRRYGYGTLRDYVIGISFVNDRGEEVKAGGRVVKNVAGYDLCKLLTGSLGTIGVITQLTLKVRPLPEQSTLMGFQCSSNDLDASLARSQSSQTRPCCVDLLSSAACSDITQFANVRPTADWLLLVGYEDGETATDWQAAQLLSELGRPNLLFRWTDADAWTPRDAGPLWTALSDYPIQALGVMTFKATMLPSNVASFCRVAEALVARLHAHAGNGIVWGHIDSSNTLDRAGETIRQLRHGAVQAAGSLVVTRCPKEWQSTLEVWGQPRGDWELMRAVKKQLDPRDIFNSGRFIAGN
jgi:glycolate oxidase FAD binding subunit